MTRTLLDKLPFEIDARIPLQLGRESISNSTVAIAELVKNAYDADATLITLKFKDSVDGGKTLLITDNGEGMDFTGFKENWLRIGTTNKSVREKSKKLKRVVTGAKGLGRLGIDRLSKKMLIYTKTPSATEALECSIEWHRYEKKKASLSEIQHSLYECSIPLSDQYGEIFTTKEGKGTRLVLEGLKDLWDLEALTDLKRQVSQLVSPFVSIEDFQINLITQFEELNGPVDSKSFLDAAKWTVRANLSETGKVGISYNHHETKTKIVTESSWEEFVHAPEDSNPVCGPLEFVLYYLPSDEPGPIAPSVTKKDLTAFMKTNQGVRIYRDKFRVRSYGEPGGTGDWLQLGDRKARSPGGIAQGGWKVGPHQILAAVTVSRTSNPNLQDQTNREGLIEGPAYFDLRRFVIGVVKGFESNAHKLAKRAKAKTRSTIEIENDKVAASEERTTQALSSLRSSIDRVSTTSEMKSSAEFSNVVAHIEQLEQELEEVKKASRDSRTAYEEMSRELENEKNTLANLASLGILSVAFGHETMQYAIAAMLNANSLQQLSKSDRLQASETDKASLDSAVETIVTNTTFIKNFSSFYLSSVMPSRRKQKAVKVSAVIERTLAAMAPILNRQNIDCTREYSGLEDSKVFAFEIDLESIFVNLLTNAVEALSMTKKGHKKIHIRFSSARDKLVLKFLDSGKGIPKTHSAAIFDPMFSTRTDRKGNQIGTGMGLSILKTIVEEHIKGSIAVIGKGQMGGAEFELTFPVRTAKGK